jgi:hypothetical protein
MADGDTAHQLTGLFITTAKAHHAATGGVNAQWAEWYADRLHADLNRLVGTDLTVDQIADWLTRADVRYRAEEPDVSWPKAYTAWFLAEVD